MDFLERVYAVRYKDQTPKLFSIREQLLLISFYLHFSSKARSADITVVSPACFQRKEVFLQMVVSIEPPGYKADENI